MDAHELVSALKSLAINLGRTPTRAEFERSVRGGKYQLERRFGSFGALIQASGLQASPTSRVKITNAVFEKDLESHLGSYEPKQPQGQRSTWPRIMVISDIHWPFTNQPLLDGFLKRVELVRPEHVIINGDAWDMFSHSKYPRSRNVFTPRQEQDMARRMNEEFWRGVQKAAPDAHCHQLLGNHDVRPMKRILESYPEAEDWVTDKLKQLFTYDGVTSIHDPREELMFGDIAVFHGYRGKLGDHRDYTFLNCVNGHTHVGGAVFKKIRGSVIWELNSGVAGDPFSKGLDYTPQKITHWTPGWGEVDAQGPRFVPFF